jgi:hypothetical protein
MAKCIVIAGALAQKPGIGGHTWVFLQYLLGFKQLGYDVAFLDRLEPEMCRTQSGETCGLDESWNLHYFNRVLKCFGLEKSYCLIFDGGKRYLGLGYRELLELLKDASFILNINGFIDNWDLLRHARRRVFLDIDPGVGQMWRALGLHDPFRGHDDFITIGERIGRPDCSIPTCGLKWVVTPQPIVLRYWPRIEYDPPGGHFTDIAVWRGAFGPIEFEGKTYGHRAHEFRKFFPLPRLTGRTFQLALDIHPNDEKDLEALRFNGWDLTDPRAVAGDPLSYQDYIRSSFAEFSAAKNIYVRSRCGWLSDRTICYLAGGRPALIQDTGLRDLYPSGNGLLLFSTLQEAIDGVQSICGDYRRHASAARDIAEDYFDSDKVLGRLLDRLQVNEHSTRVVGGIRRPPV